MRFPNHGHRSTQSNGVHFDVADGGVDGGLGVIVSEVVDDGGGVLDSDEGRGDGLGCGGH